MGGVASQKQKALPFLTDSQSVVTCAPQEPSARMTSHSLLRGAGVGGACKEGDRHPYAMA